jgi:hypothetical protein
MKERIAFLVGTTTKSGRRVYIGIFEDRKDIWTEVKDTDGIFIEDINFFPRKRERQKKEKGAQS